MKAVLMSIQPKWCEKIANGAKTIEVRKTRPKLETPFKCYIYCTKPSKKYQTICGCMVINTDELYRLPNGEIKHDWSGELMTVKEEYTKDNFLNGKVIGEFVCDRIDRIGKRGINNNFDYCYLSLNEWGNDDIEIEITDIQKSCISKSELNAYGANSSCLYAWRITDLKIYDKPKELSEFYLQCEEYGKTGTVDIPKKCKKCRYQYTWNLASKCRIDGLKPITKPPQSWCYVEELQNG